MSMPVCRAPPCIFSRTSSPTLSDVTGIAFFGNPLPEKKKKDGEVLASLKLALNRKTKN